METQDYQKIILKTGEWRDSWSDVQEVEFTGRLLINSRVEMGDPPYTDNCGVIYEIYITPKSKKIVYWEKDWNNWQGEKTVAKMEIFDSIDELEGNAPSWLIRDAKRKLGIDVVEHLDI